jgi:hypothetical protein
MVAIIGAVLFALALLFAIAGITELSPVITTTTLMLGGLLCVALHLGGVGANRPVNFRRRRARR